MVISKKFDEKIRRSMVYRLFFYSIFVASLTWLGMLMTTRDTTSSFMFNEGVLAKVGQGAQAIAKRVLNCSLQKHAKHCS